MLIKISSFILLILMKTASTINSMKNDILRMLDVLIDNTMELLPKVLMALVVIVIGYFLARIIEKIIRRLILYVDSSVNQALQQQKIDVDLKAPARFISRTVFWIIIVISILISVQILELDVTAGVWVEKITDFIPNILVAVIIIFTGIILGRLLGDLIKVTALKTGLINGAYLGRLVRYLVLFVSIIIALDQLGVDIDFLKDVVEIVLAGLLFGASLAFGLGARTSVSNILGAYYVNKNHSVGKRIKLGEAEGIIVKITDHDVSIETKTGMVIIPAKEFNEHSVTIIDDLNG